MIRHIVLFKFHDENDLAGIQEAMGALLGLQLSIPVIVDINLHLDLVRSERSATFGLVSTFHDLAALNEYRQHPAHVAALAGVVPRCAWIHTLDFDL